MTRIEFTATGRSFRDEVHALHGTTNVPGEALQSAQAAALALAPPDGFEDDRFDVVISISPKGTSGVAVTNKGARE